MRYSIFSQRRLAGCDSMVKEMETVGPFKILVVAFKNTRCHVLQDSNLQVKYVYVYLGAAVGRVFARSVSFHVAPPNTYLEISHSDLGYWWHSSGNSRHRQDGQHSPRRHISSLTRKFLLLNRSQEIRYPLISFRWVRWIRNPLNEDNFLRSTIILSFY
jgi:hypothetical protein